MTNGLYHLRTKLHTTEELAFKKSSRHLSVCLPTFAMPVAFRATGKVPRQGWGPESGHRTLDDRKIIRVPSWKELSRGNYITSFGAADEWALPPPGGRGSARLLMHRACASGNWGACAYEPYELTAD